MKKYAEFEGRINFNEIALVLANACQIYVRKVDLTYNFVLRFSETTSKTLMMVERTKKKAVEIEKAIQKGEKPPPKVKTPRKKKESARPPQMVNPFDFKDGGIFGPVDLVPVEPAVNVREPVFLRVKERRTDNSDDECVNESSILRLRRKLTLIKLMKQQGRPIRTRQPIFSCNFDVPSDNHDIPNYANGELIDLDDNTSTGSRRDFFVFMAMIDQSRHTLKLTHNYQPLANITPPEDRGCNGSTLLPPDYVKSVYNVKLRNPLYYYEELQKELELWDRLGEGRHEERVKQCVLITYSIVAEFMKPGEQNFGHSEFSMDDYSSIIQKLTRQCQSLIPSTSTTPITPYSNNSTGWSSLNLRDSFTDCGIHMESNRTSIGSERSEFLSPAPITATRITFSSSDIAQKLMNAELRISVDEGISACGSGRNTPTQPLLPRLSDLNPLTRSMLDPRVELVDFCDPLTDVQKENMQVKLNSNMFFISSMIQIPPPKLDPYDVNRMSIKLNFLKLPLNKLRKRVEFALTPDFKLVSYFFFRPQFYYILGD